MSLSIPLCLPPSPSPPLSFLMNVKTVQGTPISLRLIEKIFHRSYSYYTAGLRMYFVLIPMFAWMLSPWVLLFVVPINLFLVSDYDNLKWVEKEITSMYQEEKEVETMGASLLAKGTSSSSSKV
jgi:uncharacterized membrane protein